MAETTRSKYEAKVISTESSSYAWKIWFLTYRFHQGAEWTACTIARACREGVSGPAKF